jgi:CheY-like chemotaxis protein
VSGYGQDSDRAAALRAGFSRHLVKPVSLQEIESLVTGTDPVPAPWEVRDGKEDPDAGGRFR